MPEEINNISKESAEENKNESEAFIDNDDAEKIRQEREEYLNGWKRAKADLINYKKEELSRMKEIARFASEDIMRDIIVVLDSFDLSIAALAREEESAAYKGIYMIRTQLEDVLKKRGLERMIDSVGHPFDPSIHEAVSSVESDKESGTVIDEVEKGYFLHGKVLRPARVVVSK
ncbi:MAG: nucleotide exchange factor GrpE [Candidatus Colwellbacteria bacterium]|nr:nucleotide exchange factor GrpE [Candidatus Colwellbacteria bacterium]